MASITAPQPILQKSGYAGDRIEETWLGDNSRGRMKRDTIGGQLKFWSGNRAVNKNEGFQRMDEGNSKVDVEFDNWFDTEKDMGEWGEQKFSQDSSADPLNRSPHRKALAFFALCLAFSIVGMQRLMFVSVNSIITAQFSISSTQTAALTGVAFIFSAISNPLWEMLSMKIGKRGILIFASVLMLAGSLWNMHARSFGEFLGGRIFEGLGWGAFEGLMRGAVGDMYYESQIPARMRILSIIDLVFTWGSPIIGGYLSQTVDGYGNQIMIMNIAQAISIFLLIIGFPETAFNRSTHPTPSAPIPPTRSFKTWLKTLHTLPYLGNPSKEELLKPFKGLTSPITILVFVLSSLPIAAAYAFALSLSGFLSASPLFIFPSQVGYIFLGPFLLSIISYGLLSIISPGKPSTPTSSAKKLGKFTTSALRIAIPGLILFATGTIAFSEYVSTTVISQTMGVSSKSVFVTSDLDMYMSLRVIGLVFGVMVAGVAVLNFSVQRYLSLHEGPMESKRGAKGGLERAHNVLQNLFTGIIVIAMPSWIEGGMGKEMGGVMGLKNTGLGFGVFGFVGGVGVVVGLWMLGDRIVGWEMGGNKNGKEVHEEYVYKIKQLEV